MKEIITLNKEADSIIYLSQKDKRLAKVFEMVGELTYQPYDNPFVFLIDTIVGQMLSKKVADTLCDRMYKLCNNNITPQRVSTFSIHELRSIGISNSKANYIHNLADAVLEEKINFNELNLLTDKDVQKKLTSIRGIGNWSAKMYLIFVLDRQNILPYEDGAFMQAYSWLYKTTDTKSKSIIKKCKKWEPYSSIAARYLYKALDAGFTTEEFHLYKSYDNCIKNI